MSATIQIAGHTFAAHVCKTCGARDSNPETLAAHEMRHEEESAKYKLSGRARNPKYLTGVFPELRQLLGEKQEER